MPILLAIQGIFRALAGRSSQDGEYIYFIGLHRSLFADSKSLLSHEAALLKQIVAEVAVFPLRTILTTVSNGKREKLQFYCKNK